MPPELRALVLDRVRALPGPVQEVLLLAAAATRPTLTLLRSAAGTEPTAAALDAAERLGVAACDASGAVRFSHPLLPVALSADASGPARRRAHALLAAAVGEPVDAARHLALAHPQEDEATAGTVMAAAHLARERGEAATAAELAALAAGRTPADRTELHDQRLLAAAGFACDAGHREESERIAQSVLDCSTSAPGRVAARLVLLRNAGQALRDKAALITDGLREAAGDQALEAKLYDWAALRGLLCGELAQAAEHALRAARRAAAVGDTGTEVDALSTLARVRSLAGEPAAAEAALDQALARADHGPRSWGIQRMRAILTLDSDRVGSARAQVLALLGATGAAADVEQDVASLVALTRVQVRAGECREALRTAAHCARVVADAGLTSAPALYAAALARTFGGDTDEACRLAVEAVAASEADGDQLFLLRALAALGQAALFAGDRRRAAQSVESLRRALEIGAAMGAADPPLLCWHADLAEALVTAGETDAAATVLGLARARVTGPVPGSVLAALERTEGLREAAAGRAKEGAVLLRSSAQRLRPLELPVELVRTLTALGAVERRARHRTAARAALTEALELAERTGAAPLAARARDELARVDAVVRGTASAAHLTPAETRVADLVRGGATNREVAAELFISVKTVEGTLSRLYRKFGVRSRTELAHVMASAGLRRRRGRATRHRHPHPGPAARARTRTESAHHPHPHPGPAPCARTRTASARARRPTPVSPASPRPTPVPPPPGPLPDGRPHHSPTYGPPTPHTCHGKHIVNSRRKGSHAYVRPQPSLAWWSSRSGHHPLMEDLRDAPSETAGRRRDSSVAGRGHPRRVRLRPPRGLGPYLPVRRRRAGPHLARRPHR